MSDIERLVSQADDGTVDGEFLQYLYKGGELLSAGKVQEARDVLEKAYALQPKNQKGQNLLGLTYFKMGQFDRAAEIYELLVRENPVDPTLRVNLGLVYLKLNELQRAIRELETVIDLAPEHKKAQNYLGLAYAQVGEYARAKDCFVAAGSVTMAEKMEKALKDPSRAPLVAPRTAAPPPQPAEEEKAAAEGPAPQAAPAEYEVEIDVDTDEPRADEVSASEGDEEQAAAQTASPERSSEPSSEGAPSTPQTAPVREEWQASPLAHVTAAAALGDLTRALALPPNTDGGTFEVSRDAVIARAQGELLVRLDGLLASTGNLSFRGEMKRFRGRATDKAFGDGERRMVRVLGSGSLVFATRDRTFIAVELNEESAYFQEDFVFGFEESVIFENGRVPSQIAPDLHLVHLRGRGKVLLSVPNGLRSVEVQSDSPCRIPLAVLVGWHGNMTPKIVGVLQEGDAIATIAAVELTGEGFAILSPPKGG